MNLHGNQFITIFVQQRMLYSIFYHIQTISFNFEKCQNVPRYLDLFPIASWFRYLYFCMTVYSIEYQFQWEISYLIDNAPFDEYLYIITVYTGLHRHAGTKSNIRFMIIDGSPKDKEQERIPSDIRILDDESHRVCIQLCNFPITK